MGQQQLLLLVLGIVIVGLAVVVGIQAFGENQKKSNQDAMVNDGIRIASDAQAWALKPEAFGGGEGDFTGLDFTKLGYAPESDGTYKNVNGIYTFSETGTAAEIDAESLNDDALTVNINICGLDSDDIKTGVGSDAVAC